MRKKTLFILSAAIICSLSPWTGKNVPAESVSAPVLLEAPDGEAFQEIQEFQEVQEFQEEVPDAEEIQEEVPDAEEEKAGISDNDLLAAGGIPIDEAHFPDSNFRKYLTVSSFDKNNDGILSEQEIKNVDTIDCRKSDSDQGSQGWEKIESLEGIGYFTEIEFLNCAYNSLTSLDVSQNKKLCYLGCTGNDLTSLDVSQNKELASISCSHNRLGFLVIGETTKLTSLSCDDNQLKELDLTGVSKLQDLDCRRNKLTDLRFGRHRRGIGDIHCEDNFLTRLDLSMIEFIHELYCNDNKLSSLILGNVESVECQNNLLTELDLSNDPYLRYIDCSENMLRSLDLSRNFLKKNDLNDILSILKCNDNRLEDIKFAKDNDLWQLHCENNRLNSLDVKNIQKLGALICYGNDISALDLRKIPGLWYLHSDPRTKVVYADTPKLTSLKRYQKKAELTWEYKGVTCDGFFIYRKEGKGGWKKVGEIRKASGNGKYSYTDKYTGKESVTYTVRAFRSMRPGADEDTYTDRQGTYDKKGLSTSAVPSAPKSVRAASGNSQAKLTWKKISGISGYRIYRKDPKSTKWKKIADVKSGKTSYIDKKVKKGKTYSYRVRAYKKGTGKNKNVIANGVYSAEKKVKIR